jgi:hypothetical protein
MNKIDRIVILEDRIESYCQECRHVFFTYLRDPLAVSMRQAMIYRRSVADSLISDHIRMFLNHTHFPVVK